MGNDGGTIVRRTDIVRTKEGISKVDPTVLARIRATNCVLSRQRLQNPAVSDALGRLYNKDAVVKYLLKRAERASTSPTKEDRIAGHLRGLKDVRPLRLEPNSTSITSPENYATDEPPAAFMCPLTQRELNGKHRFVYLTPCGCVMSESGLRAVVTEQKSNLRSSPKTSLESSKSLDRADDGEGDCSVEEIRLCPVCGTQFDISCLGKAGISPGDVIILNGTEKEVEELRVAMEARREREAQKKKQNKAASKSLNGILTANVDEEKVRRKEERRKRKEEATRSLADAQAETNMEGDREGLDHKRRRVEGDHAASTTAGQLASQAKAASTTTSGKQMSAAMRSIYGLDKKQPVGETWMTRGTFTRFA